MFQQSTGSKNDNYVNTSHLTHLYTNSNVQCHLEMDRNRNELTFINHYKVHYVTRVFRYKIRRNF